MLNKDVYEKLVYFLNELIYKYHIIPIVIQDKISESEITVNLKNVLDDKEYYTEFTASYKTLLNANCLSLSKAAEIYANDKELWVNEERYI